jgi:predicted transcriptional regulator
MDKYMKQILIQLDDELAAQLERIVPGRSHRRSAFLRRVIAQALQDELEAGTRAAYQKWPAQVGQVDPTEWVDEAEALHPSLKRRRRKTKADPR